MKTHIFRHGALELSVEYSGVANFALQQNSIPMFSTLSLTNGGTTTLQDIEIRISSDETPQPQAASDDEMQIVTKDGWSVRLSELKADETWTEHNVQIDFPTAILARLDERTEIELKVELCVKDGEVASSKLQVECLAYNEWHGGSPHEQSLAAFVLPNHPAMLEIIDRMRTMLERWRVGASLSGYQSGDRVQVKNVAASVFGALQELGFSYINPPASFEVNGQKVRTPEVMLNQRMGTCLDVTLLSCAALEAVGLHPIIVMSKGHSYCGVWLTKHDYGDPVVRDSAQLRKSAKLEDIVLFDPTLAVSDNRAPFEDAERLAMRNISATEDFLFAIDIRAARNTGLRPMSSRIYDEAGRLKILDQSHREDRVRAQGIDDYSLREDLEGREKRHLAQLARMEAAADKDSIGRLERWRSKLLDLTLRNRLLNFRHVKATAMIMHHDVAQLSDALHGGQKYRLHPKPSMLGKVNPARLVQDGVYDENQDLLTYLDSALESERVHTAYPTGEHAGRMREIHRDARQGIQETGVNRLYVGIGLLRWFDSKEPEKERLAPLVLIPANIERVSSSDHYDISRREEDTVINQSLLEKLRLDFGLEFPKLAVLPEKGDGPDIELIFKQVREEILPLRGWDIIESSFLGNLSFGRFMMWYDLHENEERLFQNPLAQRLLDPTRDVPVEDQVEASETSALTEQSIAERPMDDFCVMDADSSQLEAVRAAAAGESFVLQGPPGTGKSQTIANIIAQSLADEKTVLFVAEKRAALEVVYKRLNDVGLTDYCLQLHSEKANKRDVIAQLGSALQLAADDGEINWSERVQELEESRKPLDKYVRNLHRKHPIGMSLFSAVSRLTELRDVNLVPFEADCSVDEFDEKGFQNRLEKTQALVDFAREVMPVVAHPLRELRSPAIDPDERLQIKTRMKSLQDAARAMSVQLDALPETLPALDDHTIESLSVQAELLELLSRRPPGARTLLQTDDWDTVAPKLNHTLRIGRAYTNSRDALLSEYRDEFFALDLVHAQQKLQRWKDAFFLFAFVMLWSLRRAFAKTHREPNVPDNDTLLTHVDSALEVQELERTLVHTELRELPGALWQGAATNWEQLGAATEWVERYREGLRQTRQPNAWFELAQSEFLPWQADADLVRDYIEAVQALDEAWTAACDAVRIDAEWDERDERSWLEQLQNHVERWLAGFEYYREWSLYLKARQPLLDAGFGSLVNALEHDELTAEVLVHTAEKSMLKWWVERTIASDAQLVAFSGMTHERQIERFCALDTELKQLARDEILARLKDRLPKLQGVARGSEGAVLLREMQKRSRLMPIREVFARIPTLLPRLAPCMLMSPMSVAQYLDDDPIDFDLVIFDEASQIPPWSALGSISRAKQCIVVGDSKQLPPTSFFQQTYDEEEVQEVEDLESILDECVASGLTTRRIRWHYRSRDESLIAFSNAHYYDNSLMTFPSAMGEANGLGVSYRHIEHGYYDAGRTRTNRAEAEAVVAEIVTRLSTPETASRSIGVVTFSQAQQRLIEDLLDEARAKHPTIEPYFGESVFEPVFVKNLENVQGDERDVMLFSICYAPNKQGNLSMNFGPLNQKGGERRLNVAITRAREQLIVFAKLRPEQIDLSRTSAEAVAHLKSFLKYAEIGPDALNIAQIDSATDSDQRPISQHIQRYIEAQGYNVHTQVGQSGYRVDLAVQHPTAPDFYVLGIELDGKNYRSGLNTRDRARTRPSVLRNLGWTLHRVWTPDWWYRHERELEKIGELLSELKNQPPPSLETNTNCLLADNNNAPRDEGEQSDVPASATRSREVGHKTSVAPDYREMEESQRAWVESMLENQSTDSLSLPNAKPYDMVEFEEARREQSEFNRSENVDAIAATALKVIQVEAPVHLERVCRVVAHQWGYASRSKRIDSRIQDAMQQLEQQGRVRIEGEYAWSQDVTPENYQSFRPATEADAPRRFEEISPHELANAAGEVLRYNLGLPVEELQRQVLRVFGFVSLTQRRRKTSDAFVALLIDQRRAQLDGDMITHVEKEPSVRMG